METKNEIKLVQEPIIKHELVKAGLRVTKRLSELDLENQIATIDTVKSLKDLRAELNKELSDFEDQRKFIKKAINNPYDEFEIIYKDEILEKYKNAIELLKDKISSVEIKIKEQKEAILKIYFIELCQSEEIDFITFDKLNLDINLSTSEKKYKEQINEFIQKACSDIDLIKTQPHEAEIMTEYKISLNVSKAIQDVNSRIQRENEEKERLRQIENNRRVSELKRIGMSFDQMTKSFVYNDDIYISESIINDYEKSEFLTKFIELEEKIKTDKKREIKQPVQIEIKPELKEPLKVPVKEEKEETLTTRFEVSATLKKLKELKSYLLENNITFKTI
ncbi:MAG: DUF1351 domain-containing protein [Spirochaetota bacterium]|nr:DUF1351 domain-containing protein [Spirochaetota bacterium]